MIKLQWAHGLLKDTSKFVQKVKNIFPKKIRGDCFEKFKCDIIYRSATSLYLATAIPSFKNSVFGDE